MNDTNQSPPVATSGTAPVDTFSMFRLLADEALSWALGKERPELTLFVDAATAQELGLAERLSDAPARVLLCGEWSDVDEDERFIVVPLPPGRTANSRFMHVVSSAFNVALRGDFRDDGTFSGFWTAGHERVRMITDDLALAAQVGDMPAPVAEDERKLFEEHVRALFSRQMHSLSDAAPMDKEDLNAILRILKAVSVSRRAHDIIFLFVEHIAKVVQTDRCSVVRIWGSDKQGYVLASHEDEKVDNLPIELQKYPELGYALRSGQKVVIDNVSRDPMTSPFSEALRDAGVCSLILVPIVLNDLEVGSLFLRAARSTAPFSPREISFCEVLAEAAASALERAQLFDSIQKANERLERMAVTDGLTGLFNRRYFCERMEEEFRRAHRYGSPLSCVMLDIDDFKKVNDTLGHQQGDIVLKEVAALLRTIVRRVDIVARYGGEEFVLVMPQTDAEGAMAQAERFRSELADTRMHGLPDDWSVTASVGVCVIEPETMDDYDALLRGADEALYHSKETGKNKVTLAGSF